VLLDSSGIKAWIIVKSGKRMISFNEEVADQIGISNNHGRPSSFACRSSASVSGGIMIRKTYDLQLGRYYINL
jgi:hypothetical protein